MITRYSVWLDGRGLQDIDPAIYITDIKEKEPRQKAVTARIGQRTALMRMERESLTVTIRYAIREYDTARRRDIASQARAWAHDGWLSTSDRPGQRLYVTCDKLPNVSSALKWTEEVELSFTAWAVPYWQADVTKQASYTGTNGKATLYAMGDTEALLDAAIKANGAVNSMSISVNGRKFAFAGLGLSSGQTLTISHDEADILSIRAGSVSKMSKRTADSADELLISPGANEITFTADAACSAVFTSRGRYL